MDAKFQPADAMRAAALILKNADEIASTWHALIEHDPEPDLCSPQTDLPDSHILSELCHGSIIAFGGFLRGDDQSQMALGRLWNSIQPTNAMVGDATVAISLFPEALRAFCDGADVPAEMTTVVYPAARRFMRATLSGILETAHMRPGDARWQKIAEDLEQQRQRRLARTAVLTDISRAVNTTDNLEELFLTVRNICSRLIKTDYFTVLGYDSKNGQVTPHIVYYQGVRRRDLEGTSRYAGLARVVAETQEPVAVVDYAAACAARGIEPEPLGALSKQVAFLGAPMVQSGQTVGVIALFCPLMAFDNDEVELIAAVARQTAVAIENSRLFSAERRRAAQLAAINEFAHQIVTFHTTSELLRTATDLVHESFGYSFVSVFVRDQMADTLQLRAHSPRASDSRLHELRIPIGRAGIVGDVAANAEPSIVGDVTHDVRYFDTPETANTRSELAVPIIHEGAVIGVLDVQSPEPHAFDNHDLTTLVTISDQISIALENVRLLDEERERSRALALMLSTTRAAGSSLVLDEVLERLAAGLAEAASAQTCTIYLCDEDSHDFIPTVSVVDDRPMVNQLPFNGLPLPIDHSPEIRQMLSDQQPIVCCCPHQAIATGSALSAMVGGLPSLMVPLAARGRVLGMALILGGDQQDNFSEDQIRLAQGVADSAALAIENASLYAKSQGLAIAEERGRLAQEIHDGLAQGLTAISLQLDLADAYLPAKPEKAAEKVRRALDLTRANLEEARRSVLDLRAARLQEVDLPDALRRLVQRFVDDSGIETEFGADSLGGRLSARVEMGLLRIAEEALDNIRRHSAAHQVRMSLHASEDQVTLPIEDDGVGFDPQIAARASQQGDGFGLVGVRERARLLKGSLSLQSSQGTGTKLAVTVPFEARQVQRQNRSRGKDD
jgi:signal transduction histidine kinase